MATPPPSTDSPPSKPVSIYLTVVLVFCTHGLVNALLLSGWNNPLRCLYWNLKQCNAHHSWMLNWLSFGLLHTSLLIAALAKAAMGNPLLEQRLSHLVCAMMASQLSSGIVWLDLPLNQPMAVVQVLLYLGLLLTCLIHSATTPLQRPTFAQFSSTSFDPRQKISLTTIVVAVLCLMSTFQLVDMTFGSGRQGYVGYDQVQDDVIFHGMSHMAVTQMLWVTFILAWSAALATSHQHQHLLLGHAVVLFVAQVLLTGPQGRGMQEEQARAGCVGNFIALCVALLGAY